MRFFPGVYISLLHISAGIAFFTQGLNKKSTKQTCSAHNSHTGTLLWVLQENHLGKSNGEQIHGYLSKRLAKIPVIGQISAEMKISEFVVETMGKDCLPNFLNKFR